MSRQNGGDRSSDARDPTDGDEPSIEHSLTARGVAADVQTLAALGNDIRYEALRFVAEADGAACVCELEPALGVSQGAVSRALSKLFGAGLVERRTEGRWRYYTATPGAQRLLRCVDETRASVRPEP